MVFVHPGPARPRLGGKQGPTDEGLDQVSDFSSASQGVRCPWCSDMWTGSRGVGGLDLKREGEDLGVAGLGVAVLLVVVDVGGVDVDLGFIAAGGGVAGSGAGREPRRRDVDGVFGIYCGVEGGATVPD